jgi:hypothetical protein
MCGWRTPVNVPTRALDAGARCKNQAAISCLALSDADHYHA